jgi:hypothetical protein
VLKCCGLLTFNINIEVGKMGYDVSNIIPITIRIQPQGLGFANFASATMFAPESELPVGFAVDTIVIIRHWLI